MKNINETIIYKIYIERAMKKRFTKLMYAIAIYFSLMGYLSFIDVLTPPNKYEDLKNIKGELLSLNKIGKKSYHKLVVLGDDGKKYVLNAYIDGEEWGRINRIRGDIVSVYFDYDITPFLYKELVLRSLVHRDVIVKDYDYYERSMKIYRFDKAFLVFGVFIVLFILIYIYITNCNETMKKEEV